MTDTQTSKNRRGPRPTRVCHVTTVHTPLDTRIFHRECASLARAGYEVHLVACGASDGIVNGIHVHGLPAPPNRFLRILLWPWLACRRVLAIRPALAHLHDPELMPAGQLLRMLGITVVQDIHEDVPADLLSKPYLPPWLRQPAAGVYKVLRTFLRMGIPAIYADEIDPSERGRVIQLRNFPWAAGAAERPWSPRGCRPRLIYVGVVSTDRGALTMLDVAAELAGRNLDVELRIVGPIHEPGLDGRMRQRIEQNRLSDRVSLTGRLPYEQAQEELERADIGLCLLHPAPNYVNSLPTKVLEYMKAGLPVIASDYAYWRPYVVETGAGIAVDIGSVSQMADHVQALLGNPGRMQQMSRRGLAAVRSEYCWENEQRRLLAFYRELLNG